MTRKIFISYKYADKDVKELPDKYKVQVFKNYCQTTKITTVRSYVDKLQDLLNIKKHINKGEINGEDLSHLPKKIIKKKLKKRIYYSNVTIVFISPEMKDHLKKEIDQWIHWEIYSSLKGILMNGQKSRTNAILAVVLPDKNASYNYFKYSDGSNLFSILVNNIDFHGSTKEKKFIKTIEWDLFIEKINTHIDNAVQRKKNINNYNIIMNIQRKI